MIGQRRRATDIDNPMWKELSAYCKQFPGFVLGPRYGIPMMPRVPDDWQTNEAFQAEVQKSMGVYSQRERYAREYAWTITAPATVQFVSDHAGQHIHDPLAGNGYWPYLLTQMGHRVTAADRAPYENLWADGNWYPVEKRMAWSSTYQAGPNATLFLSWPLSESDTALRCLKAFRGDRLIFVGEFNSFVCGDPAFYNRLETHWRMVDWHAPVVWEHMKDHVAVYRRVKRFGLP